MWNEMTARLLSCSAESRSLTKTNLRKEWFWPGPKGKSQRGAHGPIGPYTSTAIKFCKGHVELTEHFQMFSKIFRFPQHVQLFPYISLFSQHVQMFPNNLRCFSTFQMFPTIIRVSRYVQIFPIIFRLSQHVQIRPNLFRCSQHFQILPTLQILPTPS